MYVLFDTENGMFVKTFTTHVTTAQRAKVYKRNKKSAIDEASLMNVRRNVPKGQVPSHKYQNRPQVEVWKIDDNYQKVAVFSAPPIYLEIDTVNRTVHKI